MAEKLFYSMGEVSEMFDVNQSLIRHWEKQFDVLRPKRNKKGNRLFTPQDVEYLKLIYHLVKERGMTLEGARKALRQHRPDSGVPRDAELMERLQRIRSLLVEVREQLKEEPAGEVYSDSDAGREPVSVGTSEVPAAPAVAAEPVMAEVAEAVEKVASEPAAEPAKRPRRKKDDDDNHELFAYYEQSLF
ncbi:MAG: MerR family transcriptional regulator [Alistipes senegalensis]|nr:MerR family transcriptional regulator [Bacteroides cellulosilyticus]MCM1351796.1 MerR family transcriptional regulator [Alistipes senegalensis]